MLQSLCSDGKFEFCSRMFLSCFVATVDEDRGILEAWENGALANTDTMSKRSKKAEKPIGRRLFVSFRWRL